MFDKISNIEGDIVECGIGKIRTFGMLALLLEQNNDKKDLWGFDSFEGLPQPTSEDLSSRNPKKGEWNFLTMETAYAVLREIGINPKFIDSRTHLVKGFFEEILPKNKISKIALLHLDVDLYKSYKICLECLFPKVVRGG